MIVPKSAGLSSGRVVKGLASGVAVTPLRIVEISGSPLPPPYDRLDGDQPGVALLDHGYLPPSAIEALERQAIMRRDQRVSRGRRRCFALLAVTRRERHDQRHHGDPALPSPLLDRL